MSELSEGSVVGYQGKRYRVMAVTGNGWLELEPTIGKKERIKARVSETEEAPTMTIKADRENYQTGVKSAAGNTSMDIGDEVAEMLRGKTLQEVQEIAEGFAFYRGIDLTAGDLESKYNHLNPGHQRMIIGNMLRGIGRRFNEAQAIINSSIIAPGDEVTICDSLGNSSFHVVHFAVNKGDDRNPDWHVEWETDDGDIAMWSQSEDGGYIRDLRPVQQEAEAELEPAPAE